MVSYKDGCRAPVEVILILYYTSPYVLLLRIGIDTNSQRFVCSYLLYWRHEFFHLILTEVCFSTLNQQLLCYRSSSIHSLLLFILLHSNLI